MTRPAEGEEIRIRHAIDQLRAHVDSLELTVNDGVPATENAHAVVDAALRLATTVARRDAYMRVELNAIESLKAREGVCVICGGGAGTLDFTYGGWICTKCRRERA